MSKKILFMSSAKLTAISIGLLLAVFCTIGMSFRPVYDEDEAAEIVMLGQRRNHWTWVESGCLGDTYYYQSSVDYAKTQVQTRGNGSVTLSTSETTNVTSPVSGDPRTVSTTTATGNTVSISWNSGLSEAKTESKPTFTETQITAAHKKTFTITATPINDDYYFAGWGTSTSESSIYSNVNPRVIVSDMQITGYTSTSNAPTDYTNSSSPYTETYYAFFKQRQPVDITLKVPTNGTVSYSYESVPTTTLASETTITTKYDLTLSAAPAEGYVFFGWYTMSGSTENYISYANPNTSTYKENTTIYAKFIPAEQAIFSIKGTEQYYYDLNRACTEAASSSSKIVYLAKDGMMPAGNYTIPSGVNLLIPYNLANAYQTLPTVVTTAETLTAYRKLTLTDGVNIVVNNGAQICVGGQIMSAGGGKPSAYPTGACGVIDMSRGGHIELNNGATLYAWGFIKGQDMDQGNNTQNVGSITANSGAVVWEDFAVGDWRGGTACLTIYNNRNSWKFFPFQSYTIQNIEVPTTYKYGSTLSNYTNVYGDGHVNAGQFSIIGNSNTLFLLKDAASLVRKWYDPTTDLVCYEMSGTTQLDALNVDVEIITVSSTEFNLPLSSSMHIILTNCNTTISKPMVVQAGAVVEVKADATLTLSSNVYVFDKDQWGQYCRDKYFYSMANLSIHKDRGAGTSNAGLDDAKLFVNGGTVNITGKLYTTTSGADIMGSDGGKITFSSLPSAGNIVMCTGVSDNENVAVASANLHNENESYTQAKANKTFLNINGRWFNQTDGAAAEKANHTYDFTYISSGAVSGTGGTNTTTDAVYSWDKTGLELRQKWANVTYSCEGKDENENTHYWWQGQGEQATWFYNWTLNSDWHQFMPTATEGMYSGSNNKIYTKTECTWEELGETDVNCLYEIGGVKKALVDGQFIALEPNNNDPAYHAADDATQYYICFEGCNWHAADKYAEAEKAYIIAPDTFIWYNNAWMSANFQEPFAYTLDATNVPVYYEYADGEWTLAEPYVRVVDGLEDRTFWFLKDAFKFANSALRTSPTITILRDISGITTALSYTGANKTCTLDLNGHTITGSVSSMLTINGTGCTFIIEDNTADKKGKIDLNYSYNGRRYAVNVTKGHLKLKSGTISAINTMTYNSSSAKSTTSCAIIVKASQQCTIEGGKVYAQAGHNPFGIYGDGNSSTITIKGGEIIASVATGTEPRGIQVTGGTLNVQGGTIEATTHSSGTTGEGIYVNSAASYFATLNMTGGTVKSTTKTSSIGILVNYNYTYDTNQPRNITAQSLPVANIFGGEIQVMNANGATAEGVRSFGTTNISGGKITVRPTTTTAFGVRLYAGKTTISGTADIDVAATSTAYGVRISQENPYKTGGLVYNGTLEMTGGTLTVRTSSTTDAYGVYVGAGSLAQTHANDPSNSTYKSYYAGNYANAGAATISGGVIDVQAKTNKAYAVYVAEPVSQSGATGYETATATPNCSITGGKFKVASMTANATNIAATNVSTSTYTISGGYYNNQENVAGYTTAPKHVVTLPATDANYPEYLYKVANSYLVTFMNGSETLQSTYQEEGKVPTYTEAEPTKASAGGFSYAFNGWSTSNDNTPAALTAVTSAGATYYACFEQTDLRYTISLDATTNGGECATEYIRVAPGAAAGELPSATKEGHTFTGWFTAASGGMQLTASTVVSGDITYYAQFTVDSYTLTYALGEGKVTTAGSPIPAKNKTGTQSQSVAYGTAITAPVVARTGYTFQSWDAIVAATMPAQDVTYTPIWTPNVNTKYTVKHYLQNVDGTYPSTPTETQSLTGTTATSVTPEVKSYDGFVSPATQTVTIAAAGTTVVEYRYARRHYTFTLDAYTNGGTSEVPSIEVIHGATIGAVPPDAQKGCNDFTGWYTKPVGGVKITPEFVIEYDMKTLYAQFSDDVRTYPITYNAGANGTGTVAAGTKTCGEDATLSSNTFIRDGYAQTGWSLTDGGVQAYALGGTYTTNAALTLYPFWTLVGYQINFVDEDGTTTLGDYPKTLNPGATVTAPTEPTKAQTAEYTYTFAGWFDGTNTYASDAIPNVTAATTYTATYTATPNVASVTVSGTPTYYTTLPNAFDYVNEQSSDMTITVLRDITDITTSLVYTPAAAVKCTLDLNNHLVKGAVNQKLLDINKAGCTFTITDSSTEQGGELYNEASGEVRYYGVYLTAGTLNLEAGTVHAKNLKSDYSSLTTAAKKCMASGVYVTKSQTFNMNGGVVTGEAIYAAYGVEAAGVIVINDGTINATTTKFTTARGIICSSTTTINGGTINATAKTTTAQGVYSSSTTKIYDGAVIKATTGTTTAEGVYIAGGTTTLYGGDIEAYTTTKTCYGLYVYSGTLKVPATSTVEVTAKAKTTGAYGVYVAASKTATIEAGTFNVSTLGTTSANGVYSLGTTTIKGGTFNITPKTTTARGVLVQRGTTTISGNPVFNVKATGTAYGAVAYATTPGKTGAAYSGTLKIQGGTFNTEATTDATAYGVYAYAGTGLSIYSTASDSVPGNYIKAGIVEVYDGEFNVKAKTSAFGIVVSNGTQNANTALTSATAYGSCKVTGGKFKVETTDDANATAYAMNKTATAENLVIEGGFYNTKRTNVSTTSNIEDKYTAPTKENCNYYVLDLPSSELPYKYEVAEAYNITFKDGDNNTIQEGPVKKDVTPAYTGATPTKTEDENYTYTFNNSWEPAIVPATADATYTAQFSSTEKAHTYYFIDPTTGTETSVSSASAPADPADYDDEDNHYTFTEWAADGSNYRAQYSSSERTYGDKLDIIDWTADAIVVNANGLKADEGGTAWKIKYDGDYVYDKGTRTTDRRLLITRNSETPDSYIVLKLKGTGGVERRNKYLVPHIYDASATLSDNTKETSVVYVHTGATLTINANTTIKDLYVSPLANVVVSNGNKLTITGKLVLRTLPWQSAAIEGDVDAAQTFYTRIAPNGLEIDARNGKTTYTSSPYYQLALPYECNIADVRLSDGSTPVYNKTWLLKSYSESSRATKGATENNWVAVSNTGTDTKIKANTGYEFYSNSTYYREYYFPVAPTDNNTVKVARSEGDNTNAGWNMICSPLMSNHQKNPHPEDITVSWLNEEGKYDQSMPDVIPPAIPFFYQAAADNEEISFAGTNVSPSLAPRRRIAAADEPTRIQWIRLDVKDANGEGDETNIYSHPTRYEQYYQTGIDVAKQSLTAARARLYSSHAYGDMAFAGVSDELFEQGVALTLYSPAAQELTFSLRQNEWLNRLQYVWIIDTETGAMIDLLSSDYTASVTEGTTYGRFYISGRFRTPQIATDIDEVQGDEVRSTKAQKVLIEEKIYIMVGDKLYDATGKLVKGK